MKHSLPVQKDRMCKIKKYTTLGLKSNGLATGKRRFRLALWQGKRLVRIAVFVNRLDSEEDTQFLRHCSNINTVLFGPEQRRRNSAWISTV